MSVHGCLHICDSPWVQANEVVLQFGDHLLRAVGALRENSVGVGRTGVGQPLTFETVTGSRLRSLPLPGIGTAKLHGRGCLIEFESGAEVDFDWDQERRETFDGWRLQQFARSIGHPDIGQDELVDALESDTRFVSTEPGWFAVALLTERA